MFEGIQGAPLQVHRGDALESTDQIDEPPESPRHGSASAGR
jgi:hypothetical protein